MREATQLIGEANRALDERPDLLQLGQEVWRQGARGGARWMQAAIAALRHGQSGRAARPGTFIIIKYCVSVVAALVFAVVGLMTPAPWLAALAVLVFYSVEAQMVFLVPVVADDDATPFATSFQLTRRAGGTLRVMATVMPIALYMLGAGFFGKGFLRSWCVGCLAVCIWYERVRERSANELS